MDTTDLIRADESATGQISIPIADIGDPLGLVQPFLAVQQLNRALVHLLLKRGIQLTHGILDLLAVADIAEDAAHGSRLILIKRHIRLAFQGNKSAGTGDQGTAD